MTWWFWEIAGILPESPGLPSYVSGEGLREEGFFPPAGEVSAANTDPERAPKGHQSQRTMR